MLLVACGGDDGAATTPPGDAENPNILRFKTTEFEVPVGDSFTCFYTEHFTDEDLSIINGAGVQGPGGHHIIAYYAEEARDVGYHECSDDEMVNLRQIAGGAGEKANENLLGLPKGLALFVPAGKQIVLQAHYINTTGAPYMVTDEAVLEKGDPADVLAYVNYLVTNDDAFEVPPAAALTRTSTCTLDRDFQMALGLGHMHELGKHYTLELLDEEGKKVDTLIDNVVDSTYSSHPPVYKWTVEEPLMLKKGQKLRQTCSWNNSTMEPLLFPREMCLSFFYYWPGEGDLDCKMVEEPSGAQ